MCNQNIISNKFDLNLSTTLSSYWCTAIFYEIPLPALRFEKVEETDTKVKKTTPKRKTTPSKSRPRQKAERKRHSKKSRFTRKKTTRKEDSKTLPEIKLTYSKNGRH